MRPSPADLLTTGRAAELLGSSRQHVVDMCARGELSFVWVGRHRRVPANEIDRIVRPRLTRDQERSLWLHRAVAGRLVTDPHSVLAKAKANIDKLAKIHKGTLAGHYVEQWRALLDRGTDAVLDALTSTAAGAIELRQNSPFAGVLSGDERQACLRAFREHWSGGARGMKRAELEHILRAAATIADDREVLVIGSQAILGTLGEDQLPVVATLSMEADIAFFDDADNLLNAGIVDKTTLLERLATLEDVQSVVIERAKSWLSAFA